MIHSLSATRPIIRRKGFTLVELLVAIVIILVLAALSINLIGRAREGANSSKCAGNLRQLAAGMQMYVMDRGRYPDASRYQDGKLWYYQALPPYMGDASNAGKDLTKEYTIANRNYYYCPSCVRREPTAGGGKTYSMNESISLAPPAAIVQPEATMLLMDGFLSGNYWQHPANWGNKFPKPAHGNESSPTRVNVLFCDGHVLPLISDQSISPKSSTTSGGYVPNVSAGHPFWRPSSSAPNLGWPSAQ